MDLDWYTVNQGCLKMAGICSPLEEVVIKIVYLFVLENISMKVNP